MTIDIINYTDDQFANLNDEQLMEVKKAQGTKNRLSRKLAAAKLAERYRLTKAGIFHSKIFDKICSELQSEYDAEVELLREGLLFYLLYSGKKQNNSIGGDVNTNVGYTPDYSLSVTERVNQVKEYYMLTYSDPNQRFEAFKKDGVAPSYLCESYSSLYQWFLYDVT